MNRNIDIYGRKYPWLGSALSAALVLLFPSFSPAQTPIATRGVSGDLWADKILGQSDFSQDHENEVNAKNLNSATSAFVDNAHHNLYLWDSGNNRILVVQNFETAVTGQGADQVLGQGDFVHSGCNHDSNWQTFNWQTQPNGFYSPAVLPNANCLCSQAYMLQSPGEGNSEANMAADSQGNIYVPDYVNNRVLRFNYPVYTNEAASYVWGQLDKATTMRFDFQAYDNDGTNTPGAPTSQNIGFWPTLRGDDGDLPQQAAGVAVDNWGNLWVADSENNRVLRFPNPKAPAPGVPSTTADVVLGQVNFTSNSANTNMSNLTSFPVLNGPTVLRVDISGNVYVGETGNGGYGRISIFQPTGTTLAGVPVYGNNYASDYYVAGSTSQPMGIELDPNMNSTTQVGLWVIDHVNGAFHYKVALPGFHFTILQNFNTPEAFYSPGVAANGDLYLSDYRGMALLHYPAGSSSPDSREIFSAPAGSAGTANRIGDAGLRGVANVVVASAPGSGVTQLIAPGDSSIHFWNLLAGGGPGLSNGQMEDGYAGTSQPYIFTSTAGFGQAAVDPSNKYIWVVDGRTNPYQIDLYSLPLPSPPFPEINPVATVTAPLRVLGKTVQVSWTSLTGLTVDAAGNLWITDQENNRVLRVRDPLGTAKVGPIVDVVLGQVDPGAGPVGAQCNQGGVTSSYCGPCSNPPTASSLFLPGWLGMDHHDNLYVSDDSLECWGNQRMLRFDAKSQPTTNTSCVFAIPADGVYGTQGSFTTTGFTPYDHSFWEMAFNSNDSLMMAGTNSQGSGGYPPVILQNPLNGINPVGTPDIPGAGDNPIGHLNDYGPQTYGVAFDGQDNLYAIDGNRERILIYDQPFPVPTSTSTPTNTITPVSTPTGTLTPSSTPTPSNTFTQTPSPTAGCVGCASPQVTYGTGTAGSATGQLSGNSQLALGTTNGTESVYFADINNNRIDQFKAATGAFEAFFTGVGALNPGGLSSPYGTALSGDGRYLFAACTNGNEIVKMDLTNGGVVSAVIAVVHPVYVTLDITGTGDVYSGTDASVTRFHEQSPNSYVTVGVLGTPGVTGSGPNQLNGSYGVMVQGGGNSVFVADGRNNRIMEWTTTNGGTTYNYAATVYAGGLSPVELAPDPSNSNQVYVGTANDGYAILNMSTTPMWTLVYQCFPEGQNAPGIGVDGTSVYFSLSEPKGDSFPKPPAYCHTPLVTATVTATSTLTGTLTLGPSSTSIPSPTPLNILSCGSNAQWAVSQPSGMAADAAGKVYVVDDSLNRVDVYFSNGTPDTSVGAGILVAPAAVAVDGNGVIYVTDEVSSIYTSGQTQYRIDVFDSLTGGTPGAFSTSWGTAASSTGLLEVPVGIAANSAGTSIYVADQNLNQIEVFNGSGTALFHWGEPGAGGNGTFGYPVGAALDASGNVYVADWDTNLVQVFTPQGTWLRQWDVTQGTELLTAQDIAVYQNCLVYVTDGFGEVGVFDTNGNPIGSVIQGGTGSLIETEGVAVANTGNWYLADMDNEQVTGFNPCPASNCLVFTSTDTPTASNTTTPSPTTTSTLTNSPTQTLTTLATNTATSTASNTPTLTATGTTTPVSTATPVTVTQSGCFALSGDGGDAIISDVGGFANPPPAVAIVVTPVNNGGTMEWPSACIGQWISDNVSGSSSQTPPTTMVFQRVFVVSQAVINGGSFGITFGADDDVSFVLSNSAYPSGVTIASCLNNNCKNCQGAAIPAVNFASGPNTLTSYLINQTAPFTGLYYGVCYTAYTPTPTPSSTTTLTQTLTSSATNTTTSTPSNTSTPSPTTTATPTDSPTLTSTATDSVTPTVTTNCNSCQVAQTVLGGTGGVFNGAFGEAIDQANGILYVVDAGNNQVQKFSLNGGSMTATGTAITGLNYPAAVAFANGYLYVGENGSWAKINPTNNVVITTVAVASQVSGISVDNLTGDVYVTVQGVGLQVYQPSGSGYALASTNFTGLTTVLGGVLVNTLSGTTTVYVANNNSSPSLTNITSFTKTSETTGNINYSAPTVVVTAAVMGWTTGATPLDLIQLSLDNTNQNLYVGTSNGSNLDGFTVGSWNLSYKCQPMGLAFGAAFDASGTMYVVGRNPDEVAKMAYCGTPLPTLTPSPTTTSTLTNSPTQTLITLATNTATSTASNTPTLTATGTTTPVSTATPVTVTQSGCFALSGDGGDAIISDVGGFANPPPAVAIVVTPVNNGGTMEWPSACIGQWISDNVSGSSSQTPPTTMVFQRVFVVSQAVINGGSFGITFGADDDVSFVLSNSAYPSGVTIASCLNNNCKNCQGAAIPAVNFASGPNTLTSYLINQTAPFTGLYYGVCYTAYTPTPTPSSTTTPTLTNSPSQTLTSTATDSVTPTVTATSMPVTNSCCPQLSFQFGSNGPGNGQFSVEYDLDVDSQGNVYVTDTQNNRVEKFDQNGNYLSQWGTSGTGTGQFNHPQAIAVDLINGFVYVADTFNNRIEKFTLSGAFVNQWGGLGTGNGQFTQLTDLSVDSQGNVFTVEPGRVQKFTSNGVFVTSWTGTGVGNPFITKLSAITVGPGDVVYVTDGYDEGFGIIDKFDDNGNFITSWNELLISGSSVLPVGLATDAAGDVYVSDGDQHLIEKFTSTGQFICSFGLPQGLGIIEGLTVGPNGDIYVADGLNSRVVVFACGPAMTSTPTATNSLTATVTLTTTGTPTPTPSYTPTWTATNSSTNTATSTASNSQTTTTTVTATETSTYTATDSPTATATTSPTNSATPTPTATTTGTSTPSPTDSSTRTVTPTSTSSVTATSTRTVTRTATSTATNNFTPTKTATPSSTSTPAKTATRTATTTNTATPTVTRTPTQTPARTATATLSSTASRTATFTVTQTPTKILTATSTPTLTATATITPTPTMGMACGTSSVNLMLKEFTTCGANQSNETFEVINAGSTAVSLSQITIKFWVDDTNYVSNGADTIAGVVDYGGCFGSTCTAVSGVAVSAVNFSPACGPVSNEQANWEIKVSNSDSVNLSAGATWTNIQTTIHVNNFPNFSPGTADWYSPCGVGGGTTYTNNLNYAVYYQGNLVTASGGAPPVCRPNPTCTSTPTPHGGAAASSAERGEGTPVVTATPSPASTLGNGLSSSVVAAPNLSQNGEPIRFLVKLTQAARIKLSLYSLAGEEAYQTAASGNAGSNSLVWNLENKTGQPVASGLYIFVLRLDDGTGLSTQVGKVVVLH